MNDWRMGENGSWLGIKTYIPGRIKYLYWDSDKEIGKEYFQNYSDIKIRYNRKCFTHPEQPYKGMIITGQKKDQEKIEEVLNVINSVLKKDSKYKEFLTMWYQNIYNFQEEKKK